MAPVLYGLVDKAYNLAQKVMPESMRENPMFSAPAAGLLGMYAVTRGAQFVARKIDNRFPGFYDRFFEKFEIAAAIGVPLFALGCGLFDQEGSRHVLQFHQVYIAGMTGAYFGGLGAIAQDLSKRQKQTLEDKLMQRAELINKVPVFTINAPKQFSEGYIAKHKGKEDHPDKNLTKLIVTIGKKVNAVLDHNYHGQKLVIRTVSSYDHGANIDKLVDEITTMGTDRNDPMRAGKGYGKAPGSEIYGVSYEMEEPADFQQQMAKHIKTCFKRDTAAKPQDIIMIYAKERLGAIPYEDRALNKEGRRDLAFGFRGYSQEALIGVIRLRQNKTHRNAYARILEKI